MEDVVLMSIPINKTGNRMELNMMNKPLDAIIVVKVDWKNATPAYCLDDPVLVVDVFPVEEDQNSVEFFGRYPYLVLTIPSDGFIQTDFAVEYYFNWWVFKLHKCNITRLHLRRGYILSPKTDVMPNHRVFPFDVNDVEFELNEYKRKADGIKRDYRLTQSKMTQKEMERVLEEKLEIEPKKEKAKKDMLGGMGGDDYIR